MLDELENRGALAEQYVQVLIAQELRENNKWIVSSGGETVPVVELPVTP